MHHGKVRAVSWFPRASCRPHGTASRKGVPNPPWMFLPGSRRARPSCAGGAHNYSVKNKLIGGFGLVAWPSEYGVTGIHTFIRPRRFLGTGGLDPAILLLVAPSLLNAAGSQDRLPHRCNKPIDSAAPLRAQREDLPAA